MPREGRRATTKSFATNVHFQRDVLSRATPLFPMQAIAAMDAAGPSPAAESTAAVPRQRPGRTALIAGLVFLVLAAAATVVWLRLRGGTPAVAEKAAQPHVDAGRPPPPPIDAAAAIADAAQPDARPLPPPRRDAGPGRRPDGGITVPRATGTLRVSAVPWGDVYLDGKLLGRAPDNWTVTAGKHVVLVKGPDDQKKRFVVTVDNGEVEPVDVDFNAP
jgi:hypothetical protein